MSDYAFPGFTKFLEAAARGIGHPEAAAAARRILPLSALANLCAQAGTAGAQGAPEILAKAAEFRDQLRAAYDAAEMMLAEVDKALGLKPRPPAADAPPPAAPVARVPGPATAAGPEAVAGGRNARPPRRGAV